MKKIKILLILANIGLLSFVSCDDFGNMNLDPNNPSQADTRFLFTRACQGTTFAVYSSAPAPSVSLYDPFSQLYPEYFAEALNVQYTEFNVVDFSTSIYYYTFLRNLNLIIKMNEDPNQKTTSFVGAMGSNENQIAAAKTLKAFYYMHMSDILGMLPFSEALLGDEGNFTPKYDTQESIYTALDKELSEAYNMFDENGSLNEEYDIIYNGDISKWKKLNASLRMLMAIKLADVNPSEGKTRFEAAYNDGGIENNDDNMVYHYLNETANMNPMYDNMLNEGARRDFAPSKTIVDSLLSYNDPRLISYAVPSPQQTWDAVPFGVIRGEISKYVGKIVMFNPKLYQINSPITMISASRMLLVEAEAAVRGWITADAATLYKNGIAASFEKKDFASDIPSYAKNYPDVDLSVFLTNVDQYLAQPKVQLSGSTQDKLNKIAMQRWLDGFNENGIEAWSDWRRFNVPKLDPGKATTITHIPYRRFYYLGDYERNMDNYNAAISVQGADNFDTRLWWDVADNQ
jgi:hypothetical protein